MGGLIRAILQLPIYELVKRTASTASLDKTDSQIGQFTQRVGASFISAMLLSVLLYPFDTFKRNAQLNGGLGYRMMFNNVYECTDYVFKESKGNAGLFRGCSTFFVS